MRGTMRFTRNELIDEIPLRIRERRLAVMAIWAICENIAGIRF